jgi:hypothetical protein
MASPLDQHRGSPVSDQEDDDAPPPPEVPDELPDDSEWAIRSVWWKDGGLSELLGRGGHQEQDLGQQQPADEPE